MLHDGTKKPKLIINKKLSSPNKESKAVGNRSGHKVNIYMHVVDDSVMLPIHIPDRGYTMEEVTVPLHLDAKYTCGKLTLSLL